MISNVKSVWQRKIEKYVELGHLLSHHSWCSITVGSFSFLLTSVSHWHCHILGHRLASYETVGSCNAIAVFALYFWCFIGLVPTIGKWTSWKQTQAWTFQWGWSALDHPRQEDLLEQTTERCKLYGGMGSQISENKSFYYHADAFHVGNATLLCEMKMNFAPTTVYFLLTSDSRNIISYKDEVVIIPI